MQSEPVEYRLADSMGNDVTDTEGNVIWYPTKQAAMADRNNHPNAVYALADGETLYV